MRCDIKLPIWNSMPAVEIEFPWWNFLLVYAASRQPFAGYPQMRGQPEVAPTWWRQPKAASLVDGCLEFDSAMMKPHCGRLIFAW